MEALAPGFGLQGVDGVHKSYHTGLRGHHDGVGPGAAPEVPHAAQGLAGRYTGGGEDDVVGPDQVVQRKLLLRVVETVLLQLLDLRALRRPHPGLHLAAQALDDGRRKYSLGRPADADDGVDLGPAHTDGDGRGKVALRTDLDPRAGLPDLLDKVLVPLAVEHRDGDLLGPPPDCLGYSPDVLPDGRVYVDGAPRPGANDELAHVHVRRPQDRAPRRRRDRGDGTFLAPDQGLQALHGLDRKVHLGLARAEHVPHVESPGPALGGPDPTPLVQAFLAQGRDLALGRDVLKALVEGARRKRVSPLRVPGAFEARGLQRHHLRYGRVLDGNRCYGPRAGIDRANRLSPDLPCRPEGVPLSTGAFDGRMCLETSRSGPLPPGDRNRRVGHAKYTRSLGLRPPPHPKATARRASASSSASSPSPTGSLSQ